MEISDRMQAFATLVGRILMSLMFVMAGLGKLGNIEGTTVYMAS